MGVEWPNNALLTDASSSLRCACGAAKRERWADVGADEE